MLPDLNKTSQGVYNNLLRELQLEGSLRNYLRMTKEQFYDLVERITLQNSSRMCLLKIIKLTDT